ncbi:protein of unknown function(ATPase, AAA-type, core,38-151) [Magnetospirillum sp. XM-1]|uniref:ATP-binding protein n=1 Tax=Magnetospirillum sp. XM-1 TaxID=1663591 RepID=UPI00073DF785|nr:ATP-binding protein [Magnetospirillum sp. XM-1]CUW38708.1 protein of unknown function(ATPase, AAA-type, core,38-151) [Magnetospirillum sp. XM-1]
MNLTEKYTPKTWSDIVYPSDFTKASIENYALGKTSAPLILWGKPGNGKTTCANLIPLARGDTGQSIVDIDCTAEMTSTKFQKKMDDVSLVSGLGPRGERFVILNELDALSRRNQMMLRGVIDRAPHSTLFLATTNNPRELDPPLKNRFSTVCFDHTDTYTMETYAQRISLIECLPLSAEVIKNICVSVDGSFREMLILLERYGNSIRSQKSAERNPP